ncbi:DUF2490 domain-containing protein [uncultured Croceitalea sp.]|uniref:DUF2490 domain-containing protein n=1 Tax=uncultured Croceitalea sp. TaxID=1798908 RepID=UPI0033065B25
MKKILVLCLLASLFTNAQQPGEDKTGIWYMYFGTNKIAERWSIHTEAQFRYFETSGNFNQLLLRTGANYHINPNAIATLGYGYIDTDPTFAGSLREANAIEHRIFQQFILKNKVWEFLFEHRYRLEQRFISQKDILSDPEIDLDRTEHRARYRIQATLPLTDTFFLNFYDELFINLQDNLFGQNRLYGALGIHITANSSVQLGWLRNQFSNAVFDRLQIGFFFNPDLRKKSK